jgi:signal transduction histidine kinase
MNTEFENQTERFSDSDTLPQVTQQLASCTKVHDVLRVISDAIVLALKATSCRAFLFPERAELGNYYIIDHFPGFIVPDPPDRFTQESLNTGKIVFTEDAENHPLTDKYVVNYHGMKAAIAFPLVAQNEIIAAGVAWFNHPHKFTSQELEFVKGVAFASAMAVKNARQRSKDIELAVAMERNRIAGEMHDGIAQWLSTIRVNLNIALLSDKLDPDNKLILNETKDIVDNAYEEARELIANIRSFRELDDGNLAEFIEHLKHIEFRNNLNIDYSIDENELAKLNNFSRLHISRILGEALRNSVKHSRATHVKIYCEDTGQFLVLYIEDNGIGFPDSIMRASFGESLSGESFGIQVMKSRADDIGADLTLYNNKWHGAVVRIAVPYR